MAIERVNQREYLTIELFVVLIIFSLIVKLIPLNVSGLSDDFWRIFNIPCNFFRGEERGVVLKSIHECSNFNAPSIFYIFQRLSIV